MLPPRQSPQSCQRKREKKKERRWKKALKRKTKPTRGREADGSVCPRVVAGLGHRREERWSEPQGPTEGLPNVRKTLTRRCMPGGRAGDLRSAACRTGRWGLTPADRPSFDWRQEPAGAPAPAGFQWPASARPPPRD